MSCPACLSAAMPCLACAPRYYQAPDGHTVPLGCDHTPRYSLTCQRGTHGCSVDHERDEALARFHAMVDHTMAREVIAYEPEPRVAPIPVALAGVPEPDWHLTDEELRHG